MDTPTTDGLKAAAVVNGRDPFTRRLLLGFILFFLISLIVTGIAAIRWIDHQNQEDAVNRDTIDTLVTTANDNKSAAQKLSAQLEQLGKEPVVNTDSLPTVPKSITQGPQGLPGPAGPAPSRSLLKLLVQQSLVIACPPDGNCKGEKGDTVVGPKGDSVTGPPGPMGPAGPVGPESTVAGPAGKDAPTIKNIECDDTTGVFTFSNDSVIRVDNMCAARIVPPPQQ